MHCHAPSLKNQEGSAPTSDSDQICTMSRPQRTQNSNFLSLYKSILGYLSIKTVGQYYLLNDNSLFNKTFLIQGTFPIQQIFFISNEYFLFTVTNISFIQRIFLYSTIYFMNISTNNFPILLFLTLPYFWYLFFIKAKY